MLPKYPRAANTNTHRALNVRPRSWPRPSALTRRGISLRNLPCLLSRCNGDGWNER